MFIEYSIQNVSDCKCLIVRLFPPSRANHMLETLTSYDRGLPVQLDFASATSPLHLDLVKNIKQSDK